MKKLSLSLLSALLLVGCGTTVEQTTVEATSTPEVVETETENEGSILVVYYSAQTHTAAVADAIVDELNADVFVIEPVEVYTEDDLNWRDAESRVSKEHEDTSLRNIELVTTEVENWDSYDTVFIGYPIWWGDYSWVMTQFVENNDFNGKTVIPFCTSASSGMGNSGTNLANLAGSGNWLEGTRFSQNESLDQVRDWVSTLEY